MRQGELRVQRWLATHHAVVTRGRAVALGMTEDMIDNRLRSGQWAPLHRGVYAAASSEATPLRTLVAALAAVGPGAQASHLSAAWLWGMLREPPATPWVLGPSTRRRRPTGVRVQHGRTIPTPATCQGLPCTPAARTLTDCAAVATADVVADLVDSALAMRAVTVATLAQELALSPSTSRREGRRALRAVLARRGMIGGPAPSVLESRTARLLAGLDLPPPSAELQCTAGRLSRPDADRYRLDFAWEDRYLAVEVDGFAYHSSPEQMAHDLRRRNALAQAGWTVLVYSWKDVMEDPVRVGREISATYRLLRPVLRPGDQDLGPTRPTFFPEGPRRAARSA